ncbi:MAG: hypothetical protein HY655_04620 [Acidobacteria bacterium]|nr:hypothetical protein [Acidobacteriota bacterium]
MKRSPSSRGAVRQVVIAVLVAGIAGVPQAASASGHGPVFGMTTPTNAAGGWSFDCGVMGRSGEGDDGAMTRGMLTYGFTEDLQLSASAPLVLGSGPFAPARGTAMMPGSGDFEAIGAWRFHRRGTAVGTRVESTAYGGLIVPGPQKPAGMVRDLRRAPGLYTAVASGIASRSHYVWGGVGYTRFAERSGDQRPDTFSYSAVWGYRPPPLRKEYPHWDWRLFLEMTGEKSGNLRRAGVEHAETGGHQVLLGPTALGIYESYAIEGGGELQLLLLIGVESCAHEHFSHLSLRPCSGLQRRAPNIDRSTCRSSGWIEPSALTPCA